MKKIIKMNTGKNVLSLGNFCNIVKETAINKHNSNQVEVCCILFNKESINPSTINNYCTGLRSINSDYKQIYLNYQKKITKNKLILCDKVIEICNILSGNIYEITDKLTYINTNKKLKELSIKLINLAKEDKNLNIDYLNKLNNYFDDNNLYELIVNVIFYIVLENKQPIYEIGDNKEVIEKILNNTTISPYELEKFLNLQLKEGINFTYNLYNLAKENNAYACYELGLLEFKGEIEGYPRYYESLKYFKISSEKNHPSACYLIAYIILKGFVNANKDDINYALVNLEKAIKLGNAASLNLLGQLYLEGKYKEQNINLALKYFEEAKEKKYVYASNNLGKYYENQKQYHKALEYYQESANYQESWACNKVAEFYRLGKHVKKDELKAYKLYMTAISSPIKNRNFYAHYNLAKYYYLQGNISANIEKNQELALKHYTIASNHGIIEAQIDLLIIKTLQYKEKPNTSLLEEINSLKRILENNKMYNQNIKKKVEDNLNNIKKEINLNI